MVQGYRAMKIERFEDIEVWQLARELARKVYRLTKEPEFAKDYGLMKRSRQPTVNREPNNLSSYV
jgi:23S rRNA-intervening sequence protein